MRTRVSLCERCIYRDKPKMKELEEVYEMSGFGKPSSIWCKKTDRPEDERWNDCPMFIGYGRMR